MAFKQYDIDGLGTVTVYKRAGTKNLRLSIRPDGTIRVTVPTWAPYATGVTFARSRAEWVRKHAKPSQGLLQEGQLIGKSHHLKFVSSTTSSRVSSRVRQIQIVVTHPPQLPVTDTAVQRAASSASIRALRAQAERLLPIRLAELATKHGFRYKSVAVKQLKSRWGSCDQDTNITLNLFLMQLPWELIDYVLLHELTHTRVMQHGPRFWQAMEVIEPHTHALRRQIRTHQPILNTVALENA